MECRINPDVRNKNIIAITNKIKKVKTKEELNEVKNELIKFFIKQEKEIEKKKHFLKRRFFRSKCKTKKR